MFRRSKSEPAPEPTPTKVGGKGRPTPTRREAEAAAKARAKGAATGRAKSSTRSARAESSRQMRNALRSGDERYYPPRDRGPVRRFVRDFVDTRFSLIELVIPVLLVTMLLGFGNPSLAAIGNIVLMVMLVVVAFDMVYLRFRLRRELQRRFPDASHQGLTYYAITRALQMRFMRLPKAQVRIGQQLPEHYR